jgi:outer membrane murein-binding lipoprotein Lpp
MGLPGRHNGKKEGRWHSYLRVLLLLAIICGLTQQARTYEGKVDKLTERAEQLTQNQAKLESEMKAFAQQVRKVNGVWSDRKRQIEERLHNRLNTIDLQKAEWSTIASLAEVGFILPLTTTSSATTDEQLKNLYSSEHNRLVKNTESLNNKKSELEEKLRQVRELKEKVQRSKEAYDIKLESYKRKLKLVKFKEALVRAPAANRTKMIAERAAEEDKIKNVELAYMNQLRNNASYIQKKLEEKINHDKLKKEGLKLPNIVPSTQPAINNVPGGSLTPNPSNIANPNLGVDSRMFNAQDHSINGTHSSKVSGAMIIIPQKDGAGSSNEPWVVINNHQSYVKIQGNHSNQSSTVNISNSTGINEQQGPFIVVMKINASVPVNLNATSSGSSPLGTSAHIPAQTTSTSPTAYSAPQYTQTGTNTPQVKPYLF